MQIIRETGPESGDILIHHDQTVQMLREVATGKREATLRMYQPNPTVAFGRRDELNPGFAEASAAGEYCPGEYSVHAQLPASAGGGRVKLVGTAQRVVTGGWWFSTGIVVSDSAPLRAVTADVYRALGMDLDPATVGAAQDANPALLMEDLEDAIVEVYAQNGFR